MNRTVGPRRTTEGLRQHGDAGAHPGERARGREAARIRRSYLERRRRQALSLIPVGAVAVVLGIGGIGALGLTGDALTALVGAVVLCFFGHSLVNWRCPSCSAYLGQRMNPRDCPSCGATLRD